jgi:Prephenate dehydratase
MLRWGKTAMTGSPSRVIVGPACDLQPRRLHIVGETLVDVNHCLLALPGTRLEDVERVISHPQVSGAPSQPRVDDAGAVM